MNQSRRFDSPLFLAPGAQPAPSEQDAPVRKAWARFSHELHRSPDAPYTGMADAFEQHFSQSFVDREWRAEAATWAAAWKAAKRHGAQPAPNAVAYLDLGAGGYMDIGTDLTDEELDAIPKGRHMLGIVGTYGIDGYFPAQPAPSIPSTELRPVIEWLRNGCDPMKAADELEMLATTIRARGAA